MSVRLGLRGFAHSTREHFHARDVFIRNEVDFARDAARQFIGHHDISGRYKRKVGMRNRRARFLEVLARTIGLLPFSTGQLASS